MAPEAPGNLIVIDSRFRDQELIGLSERLEYPPEEATQIEAAGGWFYVLWNERPPGTEYIPLGNGVVYVDAKQLPSGYKPVAKSPIEFDSIGGDRYAYRYPALGEGLMFVLILPEGYTLADPQPMPKSAKIFRKKRLAVYWKPDGKYGASVKVAWTIKRLGLDIRSERDRINAEIEKAENVPDNSGVLVGQPPKVSTPSLIRNQPVSNPWISGSFYLFVFVAVGAFILSTARIVPLWTLPVIILGALLVLVAIGAFQLRHDQRLTEGNFLKLITQIFKQLPLLWRGKDRGGDKS